MTLTILAIGKKKSEYDPMIQEYKKRIVAPFSLELEILEPLGIDNTEQCRIKESEKLLSKIKKGDFVVALDERGREYSTAEFSKLIESKLNESFKRMVFVIGGAYGLDENFKSQANQIIKLGAMTMPHELARLVIAEQLYRVTNLISGGKYHHV
ncbi:MAG: rRNA ((1915)-N(3))-methyltransferase RlmH [Patescibacteria group bacterium]|nr:rRNA ((1915)-N(3))-methyltransferase RlmH [Patescibacteria group bacterium]